MISRLAFGMCTASHNLLRPLYMKILDPPLIIGSAARRLAFQLMMTPPFFSMRRFALGAAS